MTSFVLLNLDHFQRKKKFHIKTQQSVEIYSLCNSVKRRRR